MIEDHIVTLFNKGTKPIVTVLVRFPDDPDGKSDVLVTADNDAGIRAIVERRTTG